MMSSDVMQHELVERARESGTLTKADITKAWFIYWLGAEVSSSYERLQSLIFCASMTPIIKKLYPQKEEQVEALKRHLNFFNSEQTFGAVIQGISIAMEEQTTRGEPISDSAIVLSSMLDAVMIRTFSHSTLTQFAANSRVPVINGLSDDLHPCQLLADMQTFIEHRGAIVDEYILTHLDAVTMVAVEGWTDGG